MAGLRLILRRAVHRRGIAIIVILTLALGLSSTAAVFSVANAVLLRPLPWRDADRLVFAFTVLPDRKNDPASRLTWDRAPLTWGTAQKLRDLPAFSDVAVWVSGQWTLGEARQDLVEMMYASSSFLKMLGAEPQLGRFFTTTEDGNSADIVIISDGQWQRRFGRGTEALGQTVFLGPPYPNARQKSYTVVGVLPPGFHFKGQPPDFILPAGLLPIGWRESDQLIFRVMARVAPAVSFETASAMAGPVIRNGLSPDRQSGRLVSLVAEQTESGARPIGLLFLGASLLLLLCCSNVACLLLGDAWTRRHEVAIRIALGASRRQVLRELVLQNLFLASIAGALSLVLTAWLVPVLVAFAPEQLPGLEGLRIDLVVIGFGLTLAIVTGFISGLVPGLILVSIAPSSLLAQGGRATHRRHVAQRLLVTAELGVALVLLVCAGMLGETMRRMAAQPLGFDPSNLAVVTTTSTKGASLGPPAPTGESQGDTRAALEHRILQGHALRTAELLERLSAQSGVVMAAGASTLPFVSTGEEMDIRTDQASGPSFLVRQVRATEGYFRTMRVPLLSGRGFDGADLGQRLAVVSLEFERQFFSGSAVGQRFWPSSANEPFTIIGVVGDVRTPPLSEENTTLFYTLSGLVSEFVVRTSEGPELVLPRLRSAVQAYDSATIVTSMSTMDARLRGSIAPQRFRATLSEAFGYSALFLAAVGLYGLVSRRITDRRREFGIRMALGARQADIRTLIFSDGLKTVGIGLVAGVPLAVGASTFLRSLLFGISPGEATVYFWATTVLAGAAVFAMGMAIRRAGRIDPISELRL